MKARTITLLAAATLIAAPTIAIQANAAEWNHDTASALSTQLVQEVPAHLKQIGPDAEWDSILKTELTCRRVNFEDMKRWLDDKAPSRANYSDFSFRDEDPFTNRIRSMGPAMNKYYILVTCEFGQIVVKAKNNK